MLCGRMADVVKLPARRVTVPIVNWDPCKVKDGGLQSGLSFSGAKGVN
jgi:hypothetical protein